MMDDERPKISNAAMLALVTMLTPPISYREEDAIIVVGGTDRPIGSLFHDDFPNREVPILFASDVIEQVEYRYPGSVPIIEPIPDPIVEPFEKHTGKNTSLKHVKRDWELRDRRGKKRR